MIWLIQLWLAVAFIAGEMFAEPTNCENSLAGKCLRYCTEGQVQQLRGLFFFFFSPGDCSVSKLEMPFYI